MTLPHYSDIGVTVLPLIIVECFHIIYINLYNLYLYIEPYNFRICDNWVPLTITYCRSVYEELHMATRIDFSDYSTKLILNVIIILAFILVYLGKTPGKKYPITYACLGLLVCKESSPDLWCWDIVTHRCL